LLSYRENVNKVGLACELKADVTTYAEPHYWTYAFPAINNRFLKCMTRIRKSLYINRLYVWRTAKSNYECSLQHMAPMQTELGMFDFAINN